MILLVDFTTFGAREEVPFPSPDREAAVELTVPHPARESIQRSKGQLVQHLGSPTPLGGAHHHYFDLTAVSPC